MTPYKSRSHLRHVVGVVALMTLIAGTTDAAPAAAVVGASLAANSMVTAGAGESPEKARGSVISGANSLRIELSERTRSRVGNSGGGAAASRVSSGPRWQTRYVPECATPPDPNAPPPPPRDRFGIAGTATGGWERVCRDQYESCRVGGQDRVPARVERRQVSAEGIPVAGIGNWERQPGSTCIGRPDPSVPSAEQVRVAFEQVGLSRAGVKIQPVGNLTLVNLETYFEAVFPEGGFGPGEVATVTLLGHRVQLRPVQASLNFVYGDGEDSGAVRSRGGPYPSGDVRHTYQRKGDFPVRVDTMYAGQYRIGGGDWLDIPGMVTVAGTPQQLLVCEARARLVSENDDRRSGNQFEPNTPCSIRAQQNETRRANGTFPTP